mmetsp:Transcript_2901/g.6435  ORF Transcript_2901/g.6435 Transcript_2901/m.6435 type:complete len:599 (+) Transcript_2901:346-2142(+)
MQDPGVSSEDDPTSTKNRQSFHRREHDGEDQAELPYRDNDDGNDDDDDDDDIADLIDLATFDVSDVFKAVEGRMSVMEENARTSFSVTAAAADGAEIGTEASPLQPIPVTSMMSLDSGNPAPEPHEVFSNAFGGKLIPESEHEVAKAEQVLADEMANMSITERDKIMFEMHGISTETFDETPEKVEEALKHLEEHIRKIPADSREAYEQAKYISPEYVNDRAFRIMFLRSELFDSEKAALKMIKHFTIKRELFGDGEILCRDIRQSDLNEQERKTLESGFLQVLPDRDAAGRAVIILSPGQKEGNFSRPEDLMKTMWYMLSNCLEDEETQKKGIVAVVYALGRQMDDIDVMRRVHWAREGLPKRVVGIHHCMSDDSLKPLFLSVRMYLMNKQLRSRIRPHRGEQNDVMFELQTYGIPVDEQLLHPNGSLSLAWHREWLKIRRSQEEAATEDKVSSDKGVIVPRRFDVLFGRGKNTREHTGNLRCVHLVEMHQDKYEAANKYAKTEIAERIVTMVYDSYGRFLKWDSKEGWIEVDREAAREKISHFFRHLRSKKVATPAPVASKSEEEQAMSKRVTPCPSPMISPDNHVDEPSAKQIRK